MIIIIITYQDKKSEDVIFTVTYSEKHKFVWSDFYDMVLDRESTAKRLEREMEKAVNPVIQDTLKKEKFIVLKDSTVSLEDEFTSKTTTVKLMPPPNTKFSKDLKLKGDYRVVLKSDNFKLEYYNFRMLNVIP